MKEVDLLFVMATAFTASIGHCIGMCGGIVLAYSNSKINVKQVRWRQSLSHLLYNLGRVTTYTIIGVVLGALGRFVAFTEVTKGVLFVITGILMILAGLSLAGYLGFLNKIEVSFSRQPWYAKLFARLMRSRSVWSFYVLGMLNGIIPCGLVYSFAVIAAGTASPFYGGLVMLVFGLSTVPTLFALGHITDFLRRGKLKRIMMKVSALLVVLYGVFTLYKGYRFIRYPGQMHKKMQEMHMPAPEGKKCGGMKCAPGKCG